MDSSTWTKIKRSRLLLGLVNNGGLGVNAYQKFVNSNSLDMKSRLDRSIFGGNQVLFNGKFVDASGCVCGPLVSPPIIDCSGCAPCTGGCFTPYCAMHQY